VKTHFWAHLVPPFSYPFGSFGSLLDPLLAPFWLPFGTLFGTLLGVVRYYFRNLFLCFVSFVACCFVCLLGCLFVCCLLLLVLAAVFVVSVVWGHVSVFVFAFCLPRYGGKGGMPVCSFGGMQTRGLGWGREDLGVWSRGNMLRVLVRAKEVYVDVVFVCVL